MYLDNDRINELGREIGLDNIPMLLDIFISELISYKEVLLDRSLEASAYRQQIGDISHALKSSAASFGATHLCMLANDIDSKVKNGIVITQSNEGELLVESLSKTQIEFERFKQAQ